jgi:hypothetical protein
MALSDQERDRIREEEWLRLQTAEEFRRQHRTGLLTQPGAIAVGASLVILVLFSLLRTA